MEEKDSEKFDLGFYQQKNQMNFEIRVGQLPRMRRLNMSVLLIDH